MKRKTELHREGGQIVDRDERGLLHSRQIPAGSGPLWENIISESSREVENRVLELAPCTKGQFCWGASSPERPLLNRGGRDRYGGCGYRRAATGRVEELRAGEGLEIRLSEIKRGKRWHPGNDRSGHLELRRHRGRRDPVNLLFRGRRCTPGSRPWQAQTTDSDQWRRCWNLWFSSSSSFLLQERRKAGRGLVCPRRVLETQPSGDFVQGRETPTALEGGNRAALLRDIGRFWEPEIDLFGPWVGSDAFLLQILIHRQGRDETRRREGVVVNRRGFWGSLGFVGSGWGRRLRHFEQEARTAFD